MRETQDPFDLLGDLQNLFLLANESLISATILVQAGTALRHEELKAAMEHIRDANERQREWLFARYHQAAPQMPVVPS